MRAIDGVRRRGRTGADARCVAVLTNQGRAWSIIKMFDRLGNVAANDDSGDDISTRAYIAREARKPWGIWLADRLDAIEPGHCKAAYDDT